MRQAKLPKMPLKRSTVSIVTVSRQGGSAFVCTSNSSKHADCASKVVIVMTGDCLQVLVCLLGVQDTCLVDLRRRLESVCGNVGCLESVYSTSRGISTVGIPE